MNREEKSTYINSLKESLNANSAMMIYHYQGLNVTQLDDLRKKMRAAGALLKVTKNRITKIALKDTQHEEAISLFTGQTGVALSTDPITLAKTLVNFQKSNEMLKIVGGVMDKKVLAPAAATATGAAAVTPHFSSKTFDNSAASTTVNFDKSSTILFKSVIYIP